MHDDWGYDVDVFHETATPSVVMALMNELEAQSKRIAELEPALNRHYELPDVYDMEIKQFESLAKSE